MPEPAPTLRVLVIDDDPIMTELLQAVFEAHGHHVTTADSGESGLYLLSQPDPDAPLDCILTDLQLPGLHSTALATQLRARKAPATLLVGMSGSQATPTELDAFDAFLLKPFTVEQFVAAFDAAKLGSASTAPAISTQATKPILDDNTFTRLAAQLPAARLRELYDLTLADTLKRVALMQAAHATGDLALIQREAHAIKGGAGMVGASQLHALAAQRETGSALDTPPLADFVTACHDLRRMLDSRLN